MIEVDRTNMQVLPTMEALMDSEKVLAIFLMIFLAVLEWGKIYLETEDNPNKKQKVPIYYIT
jgi:hypothetical protein